MDVRLQQINPTIGAIEANAELIIDCIQSAEAAGVDVLLLTELCVPGYASDDLLEHDDFLKTIFNANERIIAATGETAVIFGTVTGNTGPGRPLFNAAVMAQQGQKVAEVHKSLLPTYDVFSEDRYFEPAQSNQAVQFKGRTIGLTICEDLWGQYDENRYHVDPIAALKEQQVDAIFNVSASPFTIDKSERRQNMLKHNATKAGCPIFYANQVGANNELIFDGDSMVLDAEETVRGRAPLFKPAFVDVEWTSQGAINPKDHAPATVGDKYARLFGALQTGLGDYLTKTAVTDSVVLGLSGGIDSALVAAIAVETLGAENVTGVAMPSEFSSAGSVTDAELLAENLGIGLMQLPVKDLYDSFLNTLQPAFEGTDFGVAEENLRSRARGMLLMALANKFNHFVLNTGNKSEMATGYCTLYGDMNGALSVLGDVYKTEVYGLARWLNETYFGREVIPSSTLTKPPSAELRPDQKDSDSLPDYDTLDTILEQYIEQQASPEAIIAEGIAADAVHQVIKLVNRTEYKRYQAPPVLKVHGKAFGSGRRQPLVQQWQHSNVRDY